MWIKEIADDLGNTYAGAEDAAKKLGCTLDTVYAAARGEHGPIGSRKLHYTGHTLRKAVSPIVDQHGRRYDDVETAAKLLGVSKSAIYREVRGHSFSYVKEPRGGGRRGPAKKSTRLMMAIAHGTKPFRDQRGRVYASYALAAEKLGMKEARIRMALKLGRITTNGYKFELV